MRHPNDPKSTAGPFSRALAIICAAVGLSLLAGCILSPAPYHERHELDKLTVIYLDEDSLRAKWQSLTGREATFFGTSTGGGGAVAVKTIRGFFDFRTNTIYCEKMDFHTCGHELHHATIGRFHTDE